METFTLRACSLLSPSAIWAARRHPPAFHSSLSFPTWSASYRSPPCKQAMLRGDGGLLYSPRQLHSLLADLSLLLHAVHPTHIETVSALVTRHCQLSVQLANLQSSTLHVVDAAFMQLSVHAQGTIPISFEFIFKSCTLNADIHLP